MEIVVRTLTRIAIYKDMAGELQVRAYYEKAVSSEDISVLFSREVGALVPNWGLDAKWKSVQGIIEQD